MIFPLDFSTCNKCNNTAMMTHGKFSNSTVLFRPRDKEQQNSFDVWTRSGYSTWVSPGTLYFTHDGRLGHTGHKE